MSGSGGGASSHVSRSDFRSSSSESASLFRVVFVVPPKVNALVRLACVWGGGGG